MWRRRWWEVSVHVAGRFTTPAPRWRLHLGIFDAVRRVDQFYGLPGSCLGAPHGRIACTELVESRCTNVVAHDHAFSQSL